MVLWGRAGVTLRGISRRSDTDGIQRFNMGSLKKKFWGPVYYTYSKQHVFKNYEKAKNKDENEGTMAGLNLS